MKIGLLDIDGHHFPNLALMKLAAYHKAQGDSVEWGTIFDRYDIAYKSKVFTFSSDTSAVFADKIIKGETGYGLRHIKEIRSAALRPAISCLREQKIMHPGATEVCAIC
ncbi:MAG: hypothetical protein LBS55_06605 [Prevotellaceae bacterium]|jgi:hypothetical protein|nr:hypothetical protein [Prevotellaceae bacterium]